VQLARSAFYGAGASLRERDGPVMEALNGVVDRHGHWGFGKCFDALRRQGHFWNHKRVWRVYGEMRLNLPRRVKKRLPKGLRQPLVAPMEPNQNAFVKRFNQTCRHEVLNGYVFEDLDQMREITEQWLYSYNEERPHDAPGDLTPAEYQEKLLKAKRSTFKLSS